VRSRLSRSNVVRVLVWVAIGVLLSTPPTSSWPVEVGIRPDSDTTFYVTWYSTDRLGFGCGPNKPDLPVYDSFELMFRPVSDTVWTSLGRTRDTFMFCNPHGHTGDYSVRGFQVGETQWNAGEYASTVPQHIDTVTLFELSTRLPCGFRFGYCKDEERTFVLDSSAISDAAFYLTDFEPGVQGRMLYLASPEYAPYDPGGSVPPSPHWCETWLTGPLQDEQSPLPAWDIYRWSKACSLPAAGLYAFSRGNRGYALISVTSVDMPESRVRLEAWHQPQSRLRLIEH
jgi:hypothetical protein